ncbi:MAG: hypothetical protein K9K32_00055 [Halanaerobiales bacterium]|nr:hypothetical protein [Halanaerobiales bacterium]
MSNKFHKNYDKWLADCRNELKKMGYDPAECEICESGKVYWGGSLVISDIGFVTPWKESRHYTPLTCYSN